jgi:anti-sigma regulatory factor (Ser/Thr protein kinase)
MREIRPMQVSFAVRDSTDVILGIRQVREAGLLVGASDVDRTLTETIISELATNIVKYADRGFVRVRRTEQAGDVDVDIWAEDHGPGIPDLAQARSDHFSTGNTLGLGLPGVERMSDAFSIRSTIGSGTEVHARRRILGRTGAASRRLPAPDPVAATQAPLQSPQWDIGMHAKPMRGERVCGDLTLAVHVDGGLLLVIVDATGHGNAASEAAARVSDFVLRDGGSDLKRLMSGLHATLNGSAGAAVGALFVDIERRTFRYSGVGNTGASRRMGVTWRSVSRDGVLGMRLPTLLEQGGTLERGDLILMWTDGISEMAAGNMAARQAYRASAQLARDIVEELGKPHDDASCIVLRWLD